MTVWINQETGEIQEGECPICEATRSDAEVQVSLMERERRKDRAARGKAERALEVDTVKARDGQLWKRLLTAWLEAFPDKRPTAKGVKSARATQVFMRLEQGATEDDFMAAIRAAKEYPFVVYGKRRRTGSESDRADDLQDIAAVKSDAMFDWLVNAGRELRENDAPF